MAMQSNGNKMSKQQWAYCDQLLYGKAVWGLWQADIVSIRGRQGI